MPEEAQALIRAYLQGAVYCWCNIKGAGVENSFQGRTFLGSENRFWQRTPMMALYEYYLEQGNQNEQYAFDEAGKAAGRILKEVIHDDKRIFVQVGSDPASYYWTGEYEDGEM